MPCVVVAQSLQPLLNLLRLLLVLVILFLSLGLLLHVLHLLVLESMSEFLGPLLDVPLMQLLFLLNGLSNLLLLLR